MTIDLFVAAKISELCSSIMPRLCPHYENTIMILVVTCDENNIIVNVASSFTMHGQNN